MDRSGLNGSVDILADAMRKVFSEAVEGAVEPLTTEVKALRTEVNDQIKTTNENMQSQFAEQQKDIGVIGSKVDKLIEAQQ